jgi:hypothetical protein
MRYFLVPLLGLFLYCVETGAADPVYEVEQLLKKGKREQALERIDAYLMAQPKDAWGRTMTQMRLLKGTLLAEQKRTDEAIAVFFKLTQDYPELPEPYNNLAVLYAGQGRLEEARDVLERALRTDPAYATAQRNLSEIYARLATQAYDHVLQTSGGERPAPVLIKELCDNYGRVALQSVGRQYAGGRELSMLSGIPKSRTAAAAPPSKVDIDEMAVAQTDDRSALPPAFVDPGRKQPSLVMTQPAQSAVDSAQNAEGRPSVQMEKDVLAAVQGWAHAWSRKDVAGYLAYYAKQFRTPNGQSRAEWEKLRRERLAKPKTIRVTVEAPAVRLMNAGYATVTFRQNYRSDNLQTSTRKTLIMVKSGEKWLIQEERVGG